MARENLPGRGASGGVCVVNRQLAIPIELLPVENLASKAARACLLHARLIEVSIVSDRAIARLHRQFMKIAGPTDVLTFAHGEIVISAQTAARAGREHGESVEREICRYLIHGLLHLRGHADDTPRKAAAMWRRQETLLDRFWPDTAPRTKP